MFSHEPTCFLVPFIHWYVTCHLSLDRIARLVSPTVGACIGISRHALRINAVSKGRVVRVRYAHDWHSISPAAAASVASVTSYVNRCCRSTKRTSRGLPEYLDTALAPSSARPRTVRKWTSEGRCYSTPRRLVCVTPERGHGVVDAQEGCRAGQFSANTLVKRNREIMSIHREASQRAGKIMSRAECKVMIVQTVKKRQPEYNFRVERMEEDVGSLGLSGARRLQKHDQTRACGCKQLWDKRRSP